MDWKAGTAEERLGLALGRGYRYVRKRFRECWAEAFEDEPYADWSRPLREETRAAYLSMLRIASDVVGGYGAGFDPEKPETYFTYMAASHMAGRVMNSFAGAGMALVVMVHLLA